MRPRKPLLTLTVVALAIMALAMTGAVGASTDGATQNGPTVDPVGDVVTDQHIEDCAADPPDDYADPDDPEGVIGWADGFWYNEPLNIDTSDGLNDEELQNLGARTTARVEAIRCLDAPNGTPPVEIQSREEYQEENSGFYENVSEKDRLSDNAVFETMLMISSEENSIDIRESNRGETVGGFYSYAEERIVIVSDDPDDLLIEEFVLAQEVGHAIQDQQFNLSSFDRPTTDIDNGILGLIEGDMNLVDQRYNRACEEGLWNEPCITENNTGEQGGGGDLPSWGLYFQGFQPYNDGPPYIQSIYNESGWDEIDSMYDDPPMSAYATVYPDEYEDIELADVEVPDQSNDEWERTTYNNSINYDTLGIASISAMFMAPAYETSGQQTVYPPSEILNTGPDGEIDDERPLNYAHPAVKGWRDDKIYTYRNDGDAGAVWKIEWASEQDAREFLTNYKDLIDIRNGESVDGLTDTYEFGDNSDYDMALTIVTDGSTVTIVTAPTVDALSAIHDVSLQEESDETDSGSDEGSSGDGDGSDGDGGDGDDGDGTDGEEQDSEDGDGTDGDDGMDGDGEDSSDGGMSDDEMDGDDGDNGTSDDAESGDDASSDDDGAGFGIVAGALAVFLSMLAARHRRRD
jgi:hypothetical protein